MNNNIISSQGINSGGMNNSSSPEIRVIDPQGSQTHTIQNAQLVNPQPIQVAQVVKPPTSFSPTIVQPAAANRLMMGKQIVQFSPTQAFQPVTKSPVRMVTPKIACPVPQKPTIPATRVIQVDSNKTVPKKINQEEQQNNDADQKSKVDCGDAFLAFVQSVNNQVEMERN